MDKEWTKFPRHWKKFRKGVKSFLDFAYTKGKPQGREISCPCADCANGKWARRNVVRDHLIAAGFVKGYDVWVNHGEDIPSPMETDEDTNDHDDIGGLLYDRFRNVIEEGNNEGLNEDARKFYNLINEAKQELYPGCEGFSTLSFIIRLYLLKCLHGWSNVSFTSLLELLKEAIPDLNIPESFNKTKKMISDLGLDYKKIHACPNDCMLFWKDHENDDFCNICKASRWKVFPQVEGESPEQVKYDYNVPAKVLRHFPLIPRLQRLFMCSETATAMRWHDEERSRDGKLRHPADGQAWKDFDRLHSEFASETRNIRLGLSSDGFNPFRTMSTSHSTWPVMMVVYNYPPWLSMKSEYTMLSLLIPGKDSPGNDIDVYLQPLIEELKELWELGVDTYDASKNQSFKVRAALLWTISDYPGYAMLSGWSTKGKFACACCNCKSNSIYLKNSRKTVYLGHRRFLSMNHAWRSNKRSFNGKEEHRSAPRGLKGTEIAKKLKDFRNNFGKKRKKKIDGPLKKKSIFFELPYWAKNTLRHNLDVMHIEKNICDSIIGTLLEISGKTKDHIIARNSTLCPLIYTNFKDLLKEKEDNKTRKERLWRYVNRRFNIADEGEKAVFSRINDAWRRHKSWIKKNHFLKYTTMKERLKNRPDCISECHFRKLLIYWRHNNVQTISKINAANRKKQKFMHRVGTTNFARIRAKLREKKGGEEVTKAEMFIETRKGRKGKELDGETQSAIDKLEESLKTSAEAGEQTFETLLGKERPGRVRCFGRTATPSLLKKNAEISLIKKQYDGQIAKMSHKMGAMESLLKNMYMQQNPHLSEEEVDNMLRHVIHNGDSPAPHSSTSNYAPTQQKVGNKDNDEDHVDSQDDQDLQDDHDDDPQNELQDDAFDVDLLEEFDEE